MKNIIPYKIFEFKNYHYEIGDIVVCIDDSEGEAIIKKDEIYKISNVRTSFGVDQFELEDVKYWWDEDRFKLANEEQITKFKKENTHKYYNL